jgi:hypothetical protein
VDPKRGLGRCSPCQQHRLSPDARLL